MWLASWSVYAPGSDSSEDATDHWSVHDSEPEVKVAIDEILEKDDVAFWAIAKITQGSEPQYTDEDDD